MAVTTCKHKRLRRGARSLLVLAALGSGVFSVSARAQMPWQQQPAYQPAPSYQQAPSYQPAPGYAPQPLQAPTSAYYPHNQGMPSPAPEANRDQDDRRLDMLASRFYAIKRRDSYALDKLARLEREVKDFRSNLAYGGYDARDIAHDARKLERRIDSQRRKWEAEAANAGMPPVAAAPRPHPPYGAPYAP